MRNALIFFLIIFFSACGPSPYFEDSKVVDSTGWKYENAVIFEVNANDNESIYNMHLVVSHSDNFSYQNLYLNIITSFPSDDDKEERLNIELSNNTGQWVGKCKDGVCQTKVYLLDNFKFPEKGTYNFSIEQLSREESLEGISELKLELYETEAAQ